MRTSPQWRGMTVPPTTHRTTLEPNMGPRIGDYFPVMHVSTGTRNPLEDQPFYTGPVTDDFLVESRGRPGTDEPRPHHRVSRGLRTRLWEHRYHLTIFAINGMNVLAIGLLIQVILVQYARMNSVSAYTVQTLALGQISFLLSRFLIWHDHDVPFVRALARFNVQQLAVTGIAVAGYVGLERLGVNYIAANVTVTAVLVPVSFVASHKWSMAERTQPRLQVDGAPRTKTGVQQRCRPIGCYEASQALAAQYRKDRR